MSKTYVFMGGPTAQGAENRREAYWKQNCLEGCYDPSLKRTFASKQAMRSHLAKHGLRDAGERINPEKHILGREKTKPNPHAKTIQQHIAQSGGTD